MTQTNRRAQSRPVPKLGPRMTRQRAAVVETLRGLDKFAPAKTIHEPVSYTHLTLPTICSV